MVKRLAKYKRFALPETITSRLDTFRYVFNPSYLNKDEGNYLAVRAWDQNTDSMLALLFFWRPNEEPVEINLNELCKQHCGSEEVSDPKMFLMDGKVYCTYNTGHKRTVQNEIYLLELEETGVKSFKRMHYPERLMIEKNWAYFIHEGELHTIYSLDPFTILKAIEITDDEIVFERHWTSEAHAYKYFSIGTQCIRDKDELKFMAHKKIYKRGKRFYFGKAFRFDPSSPDSLKMEKPSFIHSLTSLLGGRKKFNKNLFSCTYFSGLTKKDDNLVMSYGINDNNWNIVELNPNVIWP